MTTEEQPSEERRPIEAATLAQCRDSNGVAKPHYWQWVDLGKSTEVRCTTCGLTKMNDRTSPGQ